MQSPLATSVHLLSAYPNNNPLSWLEKNSRLSVAHHTGDPKAADAIIFVENHPDEDPYFLRVIHHPLVKAFPPKCVLYHDADISVTPIRTISPSIPLSHYNLRHKRSFHYLGRMCENEMLDQAKPDFRPERKYLANFLGACHHHPVRKQLLSLSRREDFLLKDTTGVPAWKLSKEEKQNYEAEYVQIMHESYFVLCPRGIGPSTYRYFETMQLGRVPVIIADQWVEVPGIPWRDFSIRIAETKVAEIPAILSEYKSRAVEMGQMARAVWEQYFSPQSSLDQLALAALDLVSQPYSFSDRWRDCAIFLEPWHLKNVCRFYKNEVLKSLRLHLKKGPLSEASTNIH